MEILDSSTYASTLKLPLVSQLPAAKPGSSWISRSSASRLDRLRANSCSRSQADPSQALEYLQGATDVQAVGDEDVRGVPTTHYKAVVDLASLAAKPQPS